MTIPFIAPRAWHRLNPETVSASTAGAEYKRVVPRLDHLRCGDRRRIRVTVKNSRYDETTDSDNERETKGNTVVPGTTQRDLRRLCVGSSAAPILLTPFSTEDNQNL